LSGSPETTSPVGRKNEVPATRSMICITDAASSGGERQQEQERRHQLGVDEEGRPPEGEALRAHLYDGDDEVDRAQELSW